MQLTSRQQQLLDVHYTELKLDPRWESVLERRQIWTVRDILSHSEKYYLAIENIGPKMMQKLYKALAKMGFTKQ